jgi:hypothetical protein
MATEEERREIKMTLRRETASEMRAQLVAPLAAAVEINPVDEATRILLDAARELVADIELDQGSFVRPKPGSEG